ncbi:MAG: polysaccharide biosynthesis protein [Oscillospiraceae bacterium]|nr:polysaccharide biosynthesis protein [Oscillospiraceae bacterium]
MRLTKVQRAVKAALDLLSVWAAVAVSFRLRFGFIRALPDYYRQNQWLYMAAMGTIFLGLGILCGIYREKEQLQTPRCAAASALCALAALLLDRALGLGIPFELPLIFGLLLFIFLLALRGLWGEAYREWMRRRKGGLRRALIYGAGEAGTYLARRLAEDPKQGLLPVGFLDDGESLAGKKRQGLPVWGGIGQLERSIRRSGAEELIIAIEKFPSERIGDVLAACRRTGCRARRFGALQELQSDRLGEARIEEIRLEDLLRREPVQLDMERVQKMLSGRCVMVTGGAGSIGSEICRQALRFGARRVVVFDIHENGLFYLGQGLEKEGLLKRCRLKVGSVRDEACLRQVMEEEHPDVVFHAAAHKHVPLMEQNPLEAVKNNVLGTLCCARAADACGVSRFVLISTDKAVNPPNIMGASKRIAELCIQNMGSGGGCVFSAVRFGNVLGSAGSVVPSFARQIEEGGPVTVTHPEMRRYFMTIPEAVQLVLEAGSMAKGAEIFVLDMGDPVKICDLARDMIRLAGLRPDEDIKIVYTGPRPGEKLFEEICLKEEDVRRTENRKIFINRPSRQEEGQFAPELELLERAAGEDDLALVLRQVKKLVPTFGEQGNIPPGQA